MIFLLQLHFLFYLNHIIVLFFHDQLHLFLVLVQCFPLLQNAQVTQITNVQMTMTVLKCTLVGNAVLTVVIIFVFVSIIVLNHIQCRNCKNKSATKWFWEKATQLNNYCIIVCIDCKGRTKFCMHGIKVLFVIPKAVSIRARITVTLKLKWS